MTEGEILNPRNAVVTESLHGAHATVEIQNGPEAFLLLARFVLVKKRNRSGSGRSSHPGKPGSIVGAAAFHDRVRDGNGWDHSAPATRTSAVDRRLSVVGRSPSSEGDTFNHRRDDTTGSTTDGRRRRPRPISTAQLKRLLVVHLPPINQLVSLGSYLISE